MYLDYFTDLNDIDDLENLSQNWWEKIKQEINKPIQTGIETAKQQARQRIQEGATRIIEEQGSKFWDRIFGKQQTPTTTTIEPVIQPSVEPIRQPVRISGLHLGLAVIGGIILYNLISKKAR